MASRIRRKSRAVRVNEKREKKSRNTRRKSARSHRSTRRRTTPLRKSIRRRSVRQSRRSSRRVSRRVSKRVSRRVSRQRSRRVRKSRSEKRVDKKAEMKISDASKVIREMAKRYSKTVDQEMCEKMINYAAILISDIFRRCAQNAGPSSGLTLDDIIEATSEIMDVDPSIYVSSSHAYTPLVTKLVKHRLGDVYVMFMQINDFARIIQYLSACVYILFNLFMKVDTSRLSASHVQEYFEEIEELSDIIRVITRKA